MSGFVYIMANRYRGTIYVERHDRIYDAITREKRLEKWNCAWKFRLIEEHNADWLDLFDTLNG